ncbi:MAG TPA: hypothetical protein VJV39_20430, partial [Dongiaceae bacterium]|nr:hypothetical protein [Dongiaceae bacterium]
MSNAQIGLSRAALATAALLLLALLSACQNKDGSEKTPGEVAGADGQPVGDPAPQALPPINTELVRVGDRVHFELDRYDLSPEA